MNLNEDPRYVEFVKWNNEKGAEEQNKIEELKKLQAEIDAIKKEREKRLHNLRVSFKEPLIIYYEQLVARKRQCLTEIRRLEQDIEKVTMRFNRYFEENPNAGESQKGKEVAQTIIKINNQLIERKHDVYVLSQKINSIREKITEICDLLGHEYENYSGECKTHLEEGTKCSICGKKKISIQSFF